MGCDLEGYIDRLVHPRSVDYLPWGGGGECWRMLINRLVVIKRCCLVLVDM